MVDNTASDLIDFSLSRQLTLEKKRTLYFNSFCSVCVHRIKRDVVHARCLSVSVKLTLIKSLFSGSHFLCLRYVKREWKRSDNQQ